MIPLRSLFLRTRTRVFPLRRYIDIGMVARVSGFRADDLEFCEKLGLGCREFCVFGRPTLSVR